MWDLFDAVIAEELNMTVSEYIEYIEALSEEEMAKVINPIIDKILNDIRK